jgi:hypothetical protein
MWELDCARTGSCSDWVVQRLDRARTGVLRGLCYAGTGLCKDRVVKGLGCERTGSCEHWGCARNVPAGGTGSNSPWATEGFDDGTPQKWSLGGLGRTGRLHQ